MCYICLLSLFVGELSLKTGDFVTSKFKDICDVMLKYKETKDKHIRRAGIKYFFSLRFVFNSYFAVISMLPRLAKCSPDLFALNHLLTCISHLLAALRSNSDRSLAFVSLGEIAVALGDSILFLSSTRRQLSSVICRN